MVPLELVSKNNTKPVNTNDDDNFRESDQAEQKHDRGGGGADGHEQGEEGQEVGGQVQLRCFIKVYIVLSVGLLCLPQIKYMFQFN